MYYDLIHVSKKLNIIGNDGNIASFQLTPYSANNLKPKKNDAISESIVKVLNDYMSSQHDDAAVMHVFNTANKRATAMFGSNTLTQEVTAYINAVTNTDMFDPNRVLAWVVTNVKPPESFDVEYIANPNHTREQTYLVSDYHDMVVLAIYMKMLLPLLSMYLATIADIYDKASYELECLSVLPDRITTLPGYIKLNKYTCMFVDNKAINHELLLKREISSEAKLSWLFSVLLIKRIISGTVFNNTTKQTLVSYLYRQIKNKNDNTISSYNYKDKQVGQGDTSETTEASVLEKFRYKDKISVAEQIMLQVASTDEYMIPLVSKYIDVDLYLKACDQYIQLSPRPTELQLNLAKMILMPLISHHALWLITQEELLRKLMLCHMLIREKHPLMSMLVIAYTDDTDTGTTYLRKSKLTEEINNELMAKYPYYKVKGMVTKRTNELKAHLVRSLLEDTCKNTGGWYVTLPPGSNETLKGFVDDTSLIIPNNIREVLCNFYMNIDNLYTEEK